MELGRRVLGTGMRGLSCVRIRAERDTWSVPACSQHRGPDPAQPLVLEGLPVALAWPPSPARCPHPQHGAKEEEGAWLLGPTGHKHRPGLARAVGASPLHHPQPTCTLLPPPSLLLLLPLAAASLPRSPPGTQHPAPRCWHQAPRTMSLWLQLKPVSAGGKGRGTQRDRHGGTGTATRRNCRGHPGHPRVPLTALPVPEGARGARLQLLPGSALVWMLFWGLFLFSFLPQIFGVVCFLLIPAWKTTELDLILLLPQEPGARSRDKGQGRHPSVGSSIWGHKFRIGPLELPPASEDRGIQR